MLVVLFACHCTPSGRSSDESGEVNGDDKALASFCQQPVVQYILTYNTYCIRVYFYITALLNSCVRGSLAGWLVCC